MLEWKILAAALSVLAVISILFVGNTGIKDAFGGIVSKLTGWLGGSPISLPGGSPGSTLVSLTLYPENFTLTPASGVNLTLGQSYFENFNGEVSVDFAAGEISLREKGSSLSVSSPIQTLTIPVISISNLVLAEKFVLQSSQSNITGDSPITVQGFSGTFSIGNSTVSFLGNVTKITGEGWVVG